MSTLSQQSDSTRAANSIATIGLLGSGQLGKMFAATASQYGIKTIAFSPESNPIVTQVAQHICSEYHDKKKLDQFIRQVDVITLEFENIPIQTINYLEQYREVRPGVKPLKIAQDRRLEKQFFSSISLPIADYAVINSLDALKNLTPGFTFPAILKTSRDGYDGKGQVKVGTRDQLQKCWEDLQQVDCILEAFVPFEQELSIIIARGIDGDFCIYGPFHNEHENHILSTSWSGIAWPEQLLSQAQDIAITIAQTLEYVGVLCVEMFVVGDTVIVNEMAPRPHNSGHLTIETFSYSQFEQQVRATLGLPIAKARAYGPSAMINLIGSRPSEIAQRQILQQPGVYWHWYGKEQALPGRKLGHITIEADCTKSLQSKVGVVKAILSPAPQSE